MCANATPVTVRAHLGTRLQAAVHSPCPICTQPLWFEQSDNCWALRPAVPLTGGRVGCWVEKRVPTWPPLPLPTDSPAREPEGLCICLELARLSCGPGLRCRCASPFLPLFPSLFSLAAGPGSGEEGSHLPVGVGPRGSPLPPALTLGLGLKKAGVCL